MNPKKRSMDWMPKRKEVLDLACTHDPSVKKYSSMFKLSFEKTRYNFVAHEVHPPDDIYTVAKRFKEKDEKALFI